MKPEIKVGLAVMSALLLLYLSVAWIQRIQVFAPDQRRYVVLATSVNGLQVGDPVNVRGYASGQVEAIEPGKEAVRIGIAVDAAMPLPEGTRAEIQLKELMGGKQIELYPGQGPDRLPAGAEIPGAASLDFSTSFSEAGNLLSQLEGQRLNRTLARFDTLGGVLLRLAQAVEPAEVEGLLADVRVVAAQARRLSSAAETQRLPQRADSLLAQGQPLLPRLDGLSAKVEEQSLPAADSLLGQASNSLRRLDTLSLAMQDLLQQVQDPETLPGRLLTDPAFAAQLDTTLQNLNRALEVIHSEKVIIGLIRAKKE